MTFILFGIIDHQNQVAENEFEVIAIRRYGDALERAEISQRRAAVGGCREAMRLVFCAILVDNQRSRGEEENVLHGHVLRNDRSPRRINDLQQVRNVCRYVLDWINERILHYLCIIQNSY